MRTIVHLSDLHFGRLDERIIPPLLDKIDAVAPDLVAISGDLTQRARRQQFEHARTFLNRIPYPRLVVPGNHDVPLFNLAARLFNPFGGYRRHIGPNLEPAHIDGEIAVVGLNSARSLTTSGRGRLNMTQVIEAADRLRRMESPCIKVIVTHHPFDVPAGADPGHLIGRAPMAVARLVEAGADLFLAGHLHLSHVGRTAERYTVAGRSALVVQAGTLSLRGRGELNSFNVLRLTRPEMTIERYSWPANGRSFEQSFAGTYRHTNEGWTA
jgi:3',5'-cyclic AMP phosphodiesterase CpdA